MILPSSCDATRYTCLSGFSEVAASYDLKVSSVELVLQNLVCSSAAASIAADKVESEPVLHAIR